MSDSATPTARAWPAALRLAVVLCAGELVLARLSAAEQVAPINIAISAGALLLLAGLPALALDLLPVPPRLRAALHTALGWALSTVLALGVVGPALAERGGRPAVLAGALALLGVSAATTRPAPARRHGPYPHPAATVGLLALAALVAWLAGPGTLPPAATLLALTLAGAGLAVLARTGPRLVLAGLLGLVVARLPVPPAAIPWAERPPGAGPDIVLVSVDTLRHDVATTMTAYRSLAAAGVSFTAAQAPAPWTLPSMASLLTGVPPSVHGAGSLPDGALSGLAASTPTLARDLAARGYDTAAVVAPNPFVGAGFGLDRGFDTYYQPGWSPHALPRGLDNLAANPLLARVAQKLLKVVLNRTVDGARVTDHALEVLAQRRDRPLFLWVHYLDPHLPYTHTRDPSVSAAARRVIDGDFHAELAKLADPAALHDELRAAYADEARFVDGQIGRLLAALGAPPPRGRVVVLTADHGEEFFEHGGFEHGHALWQELVHVPLVVTGLARAPGAVETPVGLVDVAPTLLAAAGGSDPAMRGVDLAGPLDPERPLRSGNLLRGAPERMFAVRRGPWKAVAEVGRPDALYDLATDPGERRNVAPEHPEIFAALTADQPRATLGVGIDVDTDARQKASLEALGYTAPTR